MKAFRSFAHGHGLVAALVVLAALLMRGLMPSGTMVSHTAGGVQISFCSGTTPVALDGQAIAAIRQLEAIVAQNDSGQEPAQGAAKVCPYAVLAHATLPGADPVLLAAALAFILALGFALPAAPRLRRPSFLKPPLRGPPASL